MSSVPSVDTLDADIARVREEVRLLSAQKSALRAAVLSDRDATARLRQKASKAQQEQLDALVQRQADGDVAAAHRIYTGATLFDPTREGPLAEHLQQGRSSSPSPSLPSSHAPTLFDRPLVGVRLEHFDQDSASYRAPCHIFITPEDAQAMSGDAPETRPDGTDGPIQVLDRFADSELKIVQHDLPQWMDVGAVGGLLRRRRRTDEGKGSSPPLPASERLRRFVVECQSLLMAGP